MYYRICSTDKALQRGTSSFSVLSRPSISSSKESALLRRDVRMRVYHNISDGGCSSKVGSATDRLHALFATVKDPLRSNGIANLLALETRKRLFDPVLALDADLGRLSISPIRYLRV